MEEEKIPYDKFIWLSDVAEEIRVFPDYIQYNTWCWPARIDYAKYEYKIENDKLYVKAFEYAYVDFYDSYDETDKFYLVKDWTLNTDEFNRYIDWCVNEWQKYVLKEKKKNPNIEYTEKDRQDDIEMALEVIDNAKNYSEWHEFKYVEDERYSRKAKNRILKKVRNKDYD